MACSPAPAATALIAQAQAKWPGAASAGICASPAHSAANPTSDHEKGNAVDLAHNPAIGVDTYVIADQLRLKAKAGTERRIKYIISNWRIADPKQDWAWRPYDGGPQNNGHTGHMHVSILESARNDTSPWFDGLPAGARTGPLAVAVDAARTDGGGSTGGLAGLAKFGAMLADGRTWLRVLGITAGALLIILAVVLLIGDTKLAAGLLSARTGGVVKLDGAGAGGPVTPGDVPIPKDPT